ncbi:MAG TPA: tetratricopeptide repeat protein [Tepidisphaeraceae bacterium]|jgi:tetratricopeptide (TPR) repeat protein
MSEQQDKPTIEATDEQAGEKLVLNSPEQARTLKDYALWAGVMLLAVLVVFSPAIRGKFIWDDDRHVDRNLALRSPEGLGTIWFSPGARSPVPGFFYPPQYYPLTHTSYWLEYQLAPKAPDLDPTIFHVTNLVLHGIGALLLWFLLRRLGIPGAWLAATLWAVHPLQAESAAWISERKNVLAGVFFFGSIWAYLAAFGIGRKRLSVQGPAFTDRHERDDGVEDRSVFPWNLYTVALVLFVCAMLSKTIACSMPAVVVLLVWWKQGAIKRRHWMALLPFFIIGIALAALTTHLERTNVGAQGSEWNLTVVQRILLAGRAIWFYAWKNIAPLRLTFFYPRWSLDPAAPWQWIFPIGVVAVLAILFVLRNRIGRGPFVAAAIFCGVLVPALGFVNIYPMRYSYVADHFQYLAGPSLIAAIVALLARLFKVPAAADPAVSPEDHQRPLPYILSAGVILILGGLAFSHAMVFTGMIPLWRDVTGKNPTSWIAHYNLGTALNHESENNLEHDPSEVTKMLDEAMQHFARAIELRPNHDMAYNNWGTVLLKLGNVDEATEKFQRALAINPRNVQAISNLAQAFSAKNRHADAEKLLRQALGMADQDAALGRPERSAIHAALAKTLLALGQKDAALAEYAEAVRIHPTNSLARLEFGKLLRQSGYLPDAAVQFKNAFEADSRNVEALVQLADLQTEVKNLRPAGDHLELALRLDPNAPGLKQAMEKWNAAVQAATRPSTTRSTTTRATAQTTRATTTRTTTQSATKPAR